jgi:hypothetical protein
MFWGHLKVEKDTANRNIKQRKYLAMTPIVLTAEQRKEIERRRKDTLDPGRRSRKLSIQLPLGPAISSPLRNFSFSRAALTASASLQLCRTALALSGCRDRMV